MTTKIESPSPIDFIFFYNEGQEEDETYKTDSGGHRKCITKLKNCYSKGGVKFPVISNSL